MAQLRLPWATKAARTRAPWPTTACQWPTIEGPAAAADSEESNPDRLRASTMKPGPCYASSPQAGADANGHPR